jgi:hypothetical protein
LVQGSNPCGLTKKYDKYRIEQKLFEDRSRMIREIIVQQIDEQEASLVPPETEEQLFKARSELICGEKTSVSSYSTW